MTGSALTAARHTLFEQAHHVAFLLHAHDEVDALDVRHLSGAQLGIAAHHQDEGSGVLACEPMDGLAALVVGRVGHRTGVDDTEVGPLPLGSRLNAFGSQAVAQGRGFGEIELTSQCLKNGLQAVER